LLQLMVKPSFVSKWKALLTGTFDFVTTYNRVPQGFHSWWEIRFVVWNFWCSHHIAWFFN
jgi:hypothetical protein